eukprot:scaffold328660_cov46-Prasinocladus_malaysianus.AAC.1
MADDEVPIMRPYICTLRCKDFIHSSQQLVTIAMVMTEGYVLLRQFYLLMLPAACCARVCIIIACWLITTLLVRRARRAENDEI